MLEKIKPAVKAVKTPEDNSLRNSSNIDFVNKVAKENVYLTIEAILRESDVLKEMQIQKN